MSGVQNQSGSEKSLSHEDRNFLEPVTKSHNTSQNLGHTLNNLAFTLMEALIFRFRTVNVIKTIF